LKHFVNVNMTEKEYRAHPAISHSDIVAYEKNPVMWLSNRINKKEDKPSEAMLLGTYLHALVLNTPHNIHTVYRCDCPNPESTMALKANKEWLEKEKAWAENYGRDFLLLADRELEVKAKQNFEKFRTTAFIGEEYVEDSIIMDSEYMKGKPDLYLLDDTESTVCVADYKTISTANMLNLKSVIYSRRYWRQLMYYAVLIIMKHEYVFSNGPKYVRLYLLFQETDGDHRFQPVEIIATLEDVKQFYRKWALPKATEMIAYTSQGSVEDVMKFELPNFDNYNNGEQETDSGADQESF